ncbi:MAG TPA: hypothetical protein DCF70_03960 [Treponema sp.]|nr:hypothetical protein [Treponema sp.]
MSRSALKTVYSFFLREQRVIIEFVSGAKLKHLKLFFLRNTEFGLYLMGFFGHAFFTPFFRHYGFRTLFVYNFVMALIYGIFLLLYSTKYRNFFITFSCMEVLLNSMVITTVTGADFGTALFSVCIVPSLFFFSHTSKDSHKYYIFLSIAAAICTLLVILQQFARPDSFIKNYLTAVTVYKSLYRFHTILSTVSTSFFIICLCAVTRIKLKRSSYKTRRREQELYNMANHDQLTGLMNRRRILYFFEEFERQKNEKGIDYSICIFDIDDFKAVNDTYGHYAGDIVLKKVTSLVQTLMPANSHIARWGGEEFLIIFNGASPQVYYDLENMRLAVQKETINFEGKEIKITLTFGLSSSRAAINYDRVITDADTMLMYGKQHGKNQVCVSKKF